MALPLGQSGTPKISISRDLFVPAIDLPDTGWARISHRRGTFMGEQSLGNWRRLEVRRNVVQESCPSGNKPRSTTAIVRGSGDLIPIAMHQRFAP
jgi:hypothetical protein